MLIMSHRGYWRDPQEKNSVAAFRRSFEQGFGTETDLRDCDGELVISHDPPRGGPEVVRFADFLALRPAGAEFPLALNIKADGLQRWIAEALEAAGHRNYFLFDMSVPDALCSLRAGLRLFTRQSELEPEPAFYGEAAGVWMDAFFSEWMGEGEIAGHVGAGKQVCLVSPELHRRAHLPFWERLRGMAAAKSGEVMLCTDFPEEARAFFAEEGRR